MKLLLTFLFLALAFVMPSAFAQAVPATDTAFVNFLRTTVGNTQTLSPSAVSAADIAKYSINAAANGDVMLASKASAALNVVEKVPKVAVGAAFGRFAVKALPIGEALVIGMALFDLAKELGYGVHNDNGAAIFTQKTDGVVCAAPTTCYEYSIDQATSVANAYDSPARPVSYSKSSPQLLCRGIIGRHLVNNSANYFVLTSDASTDGSVCSGTVTGGYGFTAGLLSRVVPPYDTSSTRVAPLTEVLAVQQQKVDYGSASALPRMVVDMVKAGDSLSPGELIVTGPATSAPMTQIAVDPATQTSTATTTVTNYSYSGPTITTTTSSTSNVTNTGTGVVTPGPSTVVDTAPPAEPVPQKDTCGMPGTPACKIDEETTPKEVQPNEYDAAAEPSRQLQDTLRDQVSSSADKGFFSSWSSVFVTPPLAECVPYTLPDRNGVSMGEINPCGVVNGVRTVMAYIWAITALWLALGMIRKVV